MNNGFKGSYKVSRFVLGNNPDCADSIRWEKIFVEKRGGMGSCKTVTGKRLYFNNINFDKEEQKINISFWDTVSYQPLYAAYKKIKDDSITIVGLWGKDSIKMNMNRYLK
jgi:FlaG/FlaF family flagellin (archaellin)